MVLPTDTEVSSADILAAINLLHDDHQRLTNTIESINSRVNILANAQQVSEAAVNKLPSDTITLNGVTSSLSQQKPDSSGPAIPMVESTQDVTESSTLTPIPKRPTVTSRIILTTYPGQAGINPVFMNWGHKDSSQRGPVVVSRAHGTLGRRNGM
jgi:hypothetical protein